MSDFRDPPETQADLDALAESVSFDTWVDEMMAQDGETRIEHPDHCDDCIIIDGDLIQCEGCKDYELRMKALYGHGMPTALQPYDFGEDLELEAEQGLSEPDWDFELKYRRENA